MIDDARAFLEALDPSTRKFTFQTYDDDSVRKSPGAVALWHGTLDDQLAWMRDVNACGAGVFVAVNETDGQGRRRENVTRIRAVFVDTDGADVDPILDACEAADLLPDIVVESSPGNFHLYWRVYDCSISAFSQVQAALAQKFGTDRSVIDPPRVLRLPGFLHNKRGPVQVKLLSVGGTSRAIADIVDGFGLDLDKPDSAPQRADPVPEIIPNGERNARLFSLAGSMRSRGCSGREILDVLCVVNARCETPLDPDELSKISDGVMRYEAGVDRKHDDIGNAARFAAQWATDLRYVGAWDQWLSWDGHRWARDESSTTLRCAKETARSIAHEADGVDDPDLIKAIRKHAKLSASSSRLYAMISLAKPPFAVKASDLDADPWILNTMSGVLDLRTGALSPTTREHDVTHLAPVVFDPDASCARWLAFLDEIMQGRSDLVEFLQRWAGYCLTGSVREHALVLATGGGRNGKGTFMETLAYVLGDLAGAAPPKLLIESRNDRHPTELYFLKGRRLVVSNEVKKSVTFDDEKVKSLTGGDRITARRMGADFETFDPTHKLMIAANHLPTVRDASEGFWSRVRVVPFDACFRGREDRGLSRTLRSEGAGILAWAVRGCVKWQAEGLGAPVAIEDATSAYRASEDPVDRFLAMWVAKGAGTDDVPAPKLYDAYRWWADTEGEPPVSNIQFGREIAAKGWVLRRANGVRMWSRPGGLH